jgi:hypothetical protein
MKDIPIILFLLSFFIKSLPRGRLVGEYNKHFVISFLKGKVMVLRTFHYVVCPFLSGSKGRSGPSIS